MSNGVFHGKGPRPQLRSCADEPFAVVEPEKEVGGAAECRVGVYVPLNPFAVQHVQPWAACPCGDSFIPVGFLEPHFEEPRSCWAEAGLGDPRRESLRRAR